MTNRLEALLNLLSKSPKDSFIQYGIALEYVAKKDNVNAEKYFQALLESDPNYVPAYMQYAILKSNLNEIEAAKQLFSKGIIKAKEAGDKRAASEMEEFLDEL